MLADAQFWSSQLSQELIYMIRFQIVLRFLGTSSIHIELQRTTNIVQCPMQAPDIYIYDYIYMFLVYIFLFLAPWLLVLGSLVLDSWFLLAIILDFWSLDLGPWFGGYIIYIYKNNAIQRYHNVSNMNLA